MFHKINKVLGIETSCDDTGIALYDGRLKKMIFNKIKTQDHSSFGGVYTQEAAKLHSKEILKLYQDCNVNYQDFEAIAYTNGPGLINSLLVGSCFAKSLSYALNLPCLAVDHLEGHILSSWIEQELPVKSYLSLVISGGHSHIYLCHGLKFELIAKHLDDSIGEIIDKTARLLGLGYPGGPALEKLALNGAPLFKLPQPLCYSNILNFSFSGLKSEINRLWHTLEPTDYHRANIANSLQHTLALVLTYKLKSALKLYPNVSLINIVGGVSANRYLRQYLVANLNLPIFFADHKYCTDNAGMIAYCGYHKFQDGHVDSDLVIKAYARKSS